MIVCCPHSLVKTLLWGISWSLPRTTDMTISGTAALPIQFGRAGTKHRELLIEIGDQRAIYANVDCPDDLGQQLWTRRSRPSKGRLVQGIPRSREACSRVNKLSNVWNADATV